jgi:energy-coupling factor transport system substrate-specific component
MNRLMAGGIYGLSVLVGVLAFVYPFLLPVIPGANYTEGSLENAPLLTGILLVLGLLAVVVELQGETVSAKMVAALGVLVALAATLRFVETAIPGPAGFSPLFVPIILAGYVFGARFGYLMGILTMLVSALITGGVGPWLPYQMLVAGWVGASAGWLPHFSRPGAELTLLILTGVIWGFLYGFLINLYLWPFFDGAAALTYQTGSGIEAVIGRYLAFYAATSLVWDIFRAVGNALLLLIFGWPAVRALGRFRSRLAFDILPGRVEIPVVK